MKRRRVLRVSKGTRKVIPDNQTQSTTKCCGLKTRQDHKKEQSCLRRLSVFSDVTTAVYCAYFCHGLICLFWLRQCFSRPSSGLFHPAPSSAVRLTRHQTPIVSFVLHVRYEANEAECMERQRPWPDGMNCYAVRAFTLSEQ